jgi:AraC family transcriptional regulator
MTPVIVERPEMKLVGLGTSFISILSPDRNNTAKIPPLWDEFMKRCGEIAGRMGHGAYGLVEELSEGQSRHPQELLYIAAAEVSDLADLPDGMIGRILPAGRYAKFTHQGKLDKLAATSRFIYRTWAPGLGRPLRHSAHVEVYDDRFDPGSDESEFDILVPI